MHRSGIYFHTEAQRKVAEASLAAQNEKLGGRVVTEIQKVRLQRRAAGGRGPGSGSGSHTATADECCAAAVAAGSAC